MRGKHLAAHHLAGKRGLIPAHAGKTLSSGMQQSPQTRLIPAHAGKTPTRRTSTSAAPAHPRSCGENTLIRADDKKFEGSSPLMRGKRTRYRRRQRPQGLIPAHAGKTSLSPHTRVFTAGSSPLMRGKREPGANHLRRRRLIPAHAGKTLHLIGLALSLAAHPRSCGENQSRVRRHTPPPGSSPLMRGKLIVCANCV